MSRMRILGVGVLAAAVLLGAAACSSDEKKPTVVSKILTEILSDKKCEEAKPLANLTAGGLVPFGVGTHYCNVDRTEDPRILACGFWEAGLRLFDIRNPWRPKEVAYFDTPTANVPGLVRIYAEKRELWVAAARMRQVDRLSHTLDEAFGR